MNAFPAGGRLWYLPPSVGIPAAFAQDPGGQLAVTAALVRNTVQALDAAAPQIEALSIETIIAAIDAAVCSLQSPVDPGRQAILERGPSLTGYSREALSHALDVMLPRYRAQGLRTLLTEELGDVAALDGFVPIGGTLRMARGSGRQFHLLADGVPTVSVFSLICALLLKSPVLAKPAAGGALFPSVFARTLARVESRLAEALAVIPWPGGNHELEDEALAGAGAVVAYGTDGTIADLRARTPATARFAGYGHRLSVAAVTRECLTADAATGVARRLAWDVSLFDQHGCLSPQFAAVESDGDVAVEDFAALVAIALEELSARLPRGPVSAERSAAIQALRRQAEFQSAVGPGVRNWQSAGCTDWTVLFRRDAAAAGGQDRVLTIVQVEDLAHELPVLCHGLPLSTIGVAASEARLDRLARELASLATRICPLGTMGEPPVTWRHDGMTNLGPLVTWTDLERT